MPNTPLSVPFTEPTMYGIRTYLIDQITLLRACRPDFRRKKAWYRSIQQQNRSELTLNITHTRRWERNNPDRC